MVKCERCGTGFGPIQAAILEFCPRCMAREHVHVRLIVPRVEDEAPRQEQASQAKR
jgi:predicted  nucleic acid-binding Zn-ribbon protein